MKQKTKFNLEDGLVAYATMIIRLVSHLPSNRIGNYVAGRLLEAGTLPLAIQAEAEEAGSIADFIATFRSCLQHLRVARRWLLLIKKIPLIKAVSAIDIAVKETDGLMKIFTTGILAAEQRAREKQESSSPNGSETTP